MDDTLWRERTCILTDWPEEIEYILFIDESGGADLSSVKRALREQKNVNMGERYFTVTGMILARKNFPNLRSNIMDLKNKYWTDGMFQYRDGFKRVCLHSTEIRKNMGPFFFYGERDIQEKFITDLSSLMTSLPFKIIAATIDKQKLIEQYTNPHYPYTLALVFLVERLIGKLLKPKQANAFLVLEARGKQDDRFVLKEFLRILDNGTRYYTSQQLRFIKGVYFNPKWCLRSNKCRSYVANEIADLLAHPIMSYCRSGNKNKAFEAIESKILGYPNYNGLGLKIFPKI